MDLSKFADFQVCHSSASAFTQTPKAIDPIAVYQNRGSRKTAPPVQFSFRPH